MVMSSRHTALFLFALVGCFAQNEALTPPLVQNADLLERDVMSSALTWVMGREQPPVDILDSNIFSLDTVLARPGLRRLADSASVPDREIIDDFRRRNARPGSVEGPLQFWGGYRWVQPSGVNPYYTRDDGRYLIGMSRVGFSSDYHKAFVYIMYVCGPLCGAGNFLWLERDGTTNHWYVRHEHLDWAS